MNIGEKKIDRPYRWGIVGGGRTSQVGYKHRLGALMDNTNFQLVASAFDVDPQRAKDFGAALNMDVNRCYPDYKTMFAEEAKREDGYKISDYEFLSTQRCQLFATLHAMFTFHLHHSELWPQLGVTFDAFVNALGIEKSDWEAFLADEKAYYEHLQDWYTKRYERIRHPLQIEGITS